MTEFAERKEIFESLKPLFEKAERENLWFQGMQGGIKGLEAPHQSLSVG